MAYDERTAERIREVLAGRRNLTEKTMIGGRSFMLNGNMCASVSGRGGMLIRIDPATRDHILAEPHVEPMELGGRTMTGFVRIVPGGYRTATQLRRWVEHGVAVAAALPKKKPAKRKTG